MAVAQKWYTHTDGTRMRNSTSQVLYTIPPRLLEDVFGCVLASPLQAPHKKHIMSNSVASKLIDRVVQKIYLDEITTTIADKLCETIVEHLDVDMIVASLFKIYGVELHELLIQANGDRL